VQVLADESADQRATCQRERADRRPCADRPGALPGVVEGGDDDGQRGRHQDGRAEALQEPGADQHAAAPGQPGRQRGEGEYRQPDQEQPAAAVQVGHPAAGQQ
jgi:hypothetical protein